MNFKYLHPCDQRPPHLKRCVAATQVLCFDHRMRWVIFGIWCAGVTILSSIPGGKIDTMKFVYSDKVAHFGMFFLGAFILTAAIRHSFKWSPWVIIPAVAIIMSLLGFLDEWHQIYTPKRSGADLGDWIADSLGGIAGAIALYACHGFVRLFVRRQPHSPAPTAD